MSAFAGYGCGDSPKQSDAEAAIFRQLDEKSTEPKSAFEVTCAAAKEKRFACQVEYSSPREAVAGTTTATVTTSVECRTPDECVVQDDLYKKILDTF